MKICKLYRWEASHHLNLPYASKCTRCHGHSYLVEIEVEGDINDVGMVMDFSHLKAAAAPANFDHQTINKIEWFKERKLNPTAEHLVLFIKHFITPALKPHNVHLSRIRVWETTTSWAEETWSNPALSYDPVDNEAMT